MSSICEYFYLPEQEITLTDQLVVAHTVRRPYAPVADEVLDIIAYPAQSLIVAGEVIPNIEYEEGVIKLADGLITEFLRAGAGRTVRRDGTGWQVGRHGSAGGAITKVRA